MSTEPTLNSSERFQAPLVSLTEDEGSSPPSADAFAARAWRRLLVLAVLLVALLFTASAQAQREYSAYEKETIRLTLAQLDATYESAPEGKRIGRVRVLTLDVFEPRDPAPLFLNWFHSTTQKSLVRSESLLSPGDTWNPNLAAETERNLRAYPQLSVVLVFPIKSSVEDQVDLLIVTKDVWSLRVSTQPAITNAALSGLTIAPSETNLFGSAQSISAVLGLGPNTYSIGARYFVPRVAQSRISALLSGAGIFNCATGQLEGGNGLFRYGQPLYNTLQEWSWMTAARWATFLSRDVSGQQICSGGRSKPRAFGTREWNGSTFRYPDGYLLPDERRSESLQGQVVLTRSFNRVQKLNLSFGAEVNWRTFSRASVPLEDAVRGELLGPDQEGRFQVATQYELTQEHLIGASRFWYQNPGFLPLRERRISPYVQLHAFRNRFIRLINYNTLGLQEDIQIGHDVYLKLYPAFKPLSTRNMLGVFASAMYTEPLGTGLVRVVGNATLELSGDAEQSEVGSYTSPQSEQRDAAMRFSGHLVSPDLGLGRWVGDVGVAYSPMRYLVGGQVLGGSNVTNNFGGGSGRLRGFVPGAFWGTGVATFNQEFRSRPIRVLSVLLGLSLFHDVGKMIGPGMSEFGVRHGAGIGLSFLAPQLDRQVFRIDLGVPIHYRDADADRAQVTVLASFGQTIGTPLSFPTALLVQ